VLCRGCLDERTAERQLRIRELRGGAKPATIAARLGLPSSTVTTNMHRLRVRGQLPPARPNALRPAGRTEPDRPVRGRPAATRDSSQAGPAQEHDHQVAGPSACPRARRAPRPGDRGVAPHGTTGFTARADIARELGLQSMAGMRGRERCIGGEDPDMLARERITLTGHDGQLAVFYGPELAARLRAAGPGAGTPDESPDARTRPSTRGAGEVVGAPPAGRA
jgi:hypothetical protein